MAGLMQETFSVESMQQQARQIASQMNIAPRNPLVEAFSDRDDT